MDVYIQFSASLGSYEQGKVYRLPLELATMYVKAGIAEIVRHACGEELKSTSPIKLPPQPVVLPEVQAEQPASSGDEDKPKRTRSRKTSDPLEDADGSSA